MTVCPQVYYIFSNRRSGKNLVLEIVFGQNFQFIIDLNNRHNTPHGGSDNLIARGNW